MKYLVILISHAWFLHERLTSHSPLLHILCGFISRFANSQTKRDLFKEALQNIYYVLQWLIDSSEYCHPGAVMLCNIEELHTGGL